MRRMLLIGVAAASLLAGCAEVERAFKPRSEDAANPVVGLNFFGSQRVWPDPLVFEVAQKDVTITWRLDGDGLAFAPDGIVFDDRQQEEIVRCAIGKDPRTFTCLNRHTRPGDYKYTIRLLQDGKPLAPYDPRVNNK